MAYFMASVDPPEVNRKFAASYRASFPILSDPGGDVARAFGVIDARRQYPRRWTFYIDAQGVIQAIDKSVLPPEHGGAIARKLAELGFPLKPTDEANR